MRIDLHNALAALKSDAIKLFTSADDRLAKTKREIDELSSGEAKAKYTPDYLKSQIAHAMRKAKADADTRFADVAALAGRIDAARQAWTTEAMLRKAKLSPDSEDVNEQILAELKFMRVTSELQAATAHELASAATGAKESGSLALLGLIQREASRRKFDTDADRAVVAVAIDRAIKEIEIPEQKQAMVMLAEAQLGLEAAQDTLAELSTGKETDRARMRRVMAEQSARNAASDTNPTPDEK